MLLFSRQGKLRLQKWYVPLSDKEKKKITRELVQTVLARKPKMCSFLEWRDLKIVYKRSVSGRWSVTSFSRISTTRAGFYQDWATSTGTKTGAPWTHCPVRDFIKHESIENVLNISAILLPCLSRDDHRYYFTSLRLAWFEPAPLLQLSWIVYLTYPYEHHVLISEELYTHSPLWSWPTDHTRFNFLKLSTWPYFLQSTTPPSAFKGSTPDHTSFSIQGISIWPHPL